MTLAELVDGVIKTTDREELASAIQLAIIKATIKFHSADFWNRDLVERKIDSGISQTYYPRYEIGVQSNLPGFRKMAYLHGWDPVALAETHELKEGSPLRIRNAYGVLQTDIYYLAGDSLNIYSSREILGLLAGYYSFPNISVTKYDSWIANLVPHVLMEEASKEIFGMIGNTDEANRRKNEFPQNLLLVRQQDVLASTGRSS